MPTKRALEDHPRVCQCLGSDGDQGRSSTSSAPVNGSSSPSPFPSVFTSLFTLFTSPSPSSSISSAPLFFPFPSPLASPFAPSTIFSASAAEIVVSVLTAGTLVSAPASSSAILAFCSSTIAFALARASALDEAGSREDDTVGMPLVGVLVYCVSLRDGG
jgi:hypothetical protein